MGAKNPVLLRDGDHACAYFNRKKKFFGKWNSPDSRREFKAYRDKWQAAQDTPAVAATPNPIIVECISAYLDHCLAYYSDS